MPPRKKRSDTIPAELKTADYRHSAEKRTNIPPARIAGEGTVPQVPKARYAYSPHLSPALQFDPTGEPDKLEELVARATKGPLSAADADRLRSALRVLEPTLEWAGKREQREKGFLEVDPVALHIHERVSARAIIRSALREDVQRDLFADPQQPYQEAVQFYRHDVDWANRLILGDSLQVMSSLGRRENLAGKVQMIYMDPPYGIKFASNFQNEVGKTSVKDKEQDLTREPEMVRAYRDTWTLGVHSYLAYLRDRLAICHELLTDAGSLFLQISDENLHRVRSVLDEVFGAENFCSLITVEKTQSQTADELASVSDYVLWYARNRQSVKYRQLFLTKSVGREGASGYTIAEDSNTGAVRNLSKKEIDSPESIDPSFKILDGTPLVSESGGKDSQFPVHFAGRDYLPGKNYWKTNRVGFSRLIGSERLIALGNRIEYRRYLDDFPAFPLANLWTGLGERGFVGSRRYVVQTPAKLIERCLLMTSEPGDLVLDPTCGSGTTAFAAESWGRRWITIDTSRVALGVARQRLLTAKYEFFKTRSSVTSDLGNRSADPAAGFVYKTISRITLRSIAQNTTLDEVVAKHAQRLDAFLSELNRALREVPEGLRAMLAAKLKTKEHQNGKRSVTDADRRRWSLPMDGWEHWQVPFDSDDSWPPLLREALSAYRAAWRTKMQEVHAVVAANAEQIELVDQPEVTKGIVRVSGPFTVEGVRSEELSLGEEGLFDGTPNDVEHGERDLAAVAQQQNLHAYLERMVRLIKQDGLTFLNNQRRTFSQAEPLFAQGTGDVLHAEGTWVGEGGDGTHEVAIGFGPQYGPVTSLQVEELIRASKRHSELVIAGFSFDADATSLIQQYSSPKLRIHQAYIRPDVNPGMDGLLKETPNSQLFTVFGSPEIELSKDEQGDWLVELKGVDIYDPVANTVRSSGADKVSAWFLDSDFDGRCFATTQAFFPNQNAWEKIAKALGSSADAEAFEMFKGTVSVPFGAGTHKRVAVKVIDPRGNEVMAVRALEE